MKPLNPKVIDKLNKDFDNMEAILSKVENKVYFLIAVKEYEQTKEYKRQQIYKKMLYYINIAILFMVSRKKKVYF